MKKPKMILALIVVTSLSKAQSIPNAGFESWITSTISPQSYITTQFWFNDYDSENNLNNAAYTASSVVQSSLSHSGQYAVLLQTAVGDDNTISGSLSTCKVGNSLATFNGTCSFPINSKPTSLSGYFKSNFIGGGRVMVAKSLTRWNSLTHIGIEQQSISNSLSFIPNPSSYIIEFITDSIINCQKINLLNQLMVFIM